MKLFKDIATGKEVFTDAYKVEKLEDIYYKVTGEYQVVHGGIDDSLIGGNKSAEAEDEETEEEKRVVANILDAARMEESSIIDSKKQYQKEMKKYVNKLLARLEEKDPERAKFFKENVGAKFVQPMSKKFDRLDFYYLEGDYGDAGPIIHVEHEEEDNSEDPGKKFFIYVLVDSLEQETC